MNVIFEDTLKLLKLFKILKYSEHPELYGPIDTTALIFIYTSISFYRNPTCYSLS